MLTTLRIKNLALVTDLTIELKPGYNVITGETGAGKSILIGALNLMRARSTRSKADIHYRREQPPIYQWLGDYTQCAGHGGRMAGGYSWTSRAPIAAAPGPADGDPRRVWRLGE